MISVMDGRREKEGEGNEGGGGFLTRSMTFDVSFLYSTEYAYCSRALKMRPWVGRRASEIDDYKQKTRIYYYVVKIKKSLDFELFLCL